MNPMPSMARAALFEELAQAGPGQLGVVCVSRRLAQHLFDAYAGHRAAAGARAWETPDIQPLEGFLRSRHEAAQLDAPGAASRLGLPLGSREERLLWAEVVMQTPTEPPLLREAEAARLAQEAWGLVQDYGLKLPLPETGPEVEGFNRWAAQFGARLRQLGRLDVASWRQALLRAIAAREIAVPPSIVLAGMDPGAAPVRRLIQALEDAGCQLRLLAGNETPALPRLVHAADAERELRAAAQWARKRALASERARIAVVIPDLGARQAEVQRLFDEQLCPQVDAPGAHSPGRPYDLSLGRPLTQTALVMTALDLLQLLQHGLSAAQASRLLCSPYWGAGEAERLARTRLDAALRSDGHTDVSLEVLLAQKRTPAPLRARLQALRGAQLRGRRLPSEWIERLEQLLETAGWPGARPLDSEEFQITQSWREALRELGQLDALLGRVDFAAALSALREVCADSIFQVQVRSPRVLVLGALEAEGLQFDHLWVCGLDDEHWPPSSRPHPFIPHALQRAHGLPHASALQELGYARGMTARWCRAAPEVVFSWPREADDRPLSPSPLLAAWLATAEALTPPELPPAWRAQQGAVALETALDAQGPPLPAGGVQRGGVRLLGDQASCPMRAFARHRLGAQGLDSAAPGLSAADRGNLVHAALERLWRDLRDHATLVALDAPARRARVDAAVEAALAELAAEAPHRLRPALRALEADRLVALLEAWLQIESARAPFAVVEVEGQRLDGSEAEREVEFEGLRLRLRRDRVDALPDGGRVVIDYKTGASLKPPWDDPRPEEPQLLLYALTGEPVDAVAYGRVNIGKLGYLGLARVSDLGPGIETFDAGAPAGEPGDWQALLGRWRGQLATLAEEVKTGWAAVSPKHPRQTCQNCDLQALCRVQETLAAGDDEEDCA